MIEARELDLKIAALFRVSAEGVKEGRQLL
jgi:hypothetical protein